MIEQEKYDVAVILISYNSSQHTNHCVDSILQYTSEDLNYQIIILDKAYKKKDYLNLKKFCDQKNNPKIKLYRSNINTGFGGGNMHGFQYANANYFEFLNNDTLLHNDCISIFKKYLEKNESVGVVGKQAYKQDKSYIISTDHFASPSREIIGKNILEKINSTKYPKRKKNYKNPIRVNFVSGSFIPLRTKYFNEIGGFDPNCFLYYEETDLCRWLLGISNFACLIPEAELIHFHRVSTEKSIAIKTELKIYLLYLIRRRYGCFWHKALLTYSQFQYFFKSFLNQNIGLYLKCFIGAPLSKALKMNQKIVKI